MNEPQTSADDLVLWALGIVAFVGAPLGALYLLVRFVKWAWGNP